MAQVGIQPGSVEQLRDHLLSIVSSSDDPTASQQLIDEFASAVRVQIVEEARAFLAENAEVFEDHELIEHLSRGVVPAETQPMQPVDEVKCPSCDATLRARMSDR